MEHVERAIVMTSRDSVDRADLAVTLDADASPPFQLPEAGVRLEEAARHLLLRALERTRQPEPRRSDG